MSNTCFVPSLLDIDKEEREQQPSVLYQELLEAMGDEDLAKSQLSKCTGERFISEFGNYKVSKESGHSADINLRDGDKFAPRVYDNGEPKLFKKSVYKTNSKGEETEFIEYNQYYFECQDGEKYFIDKVRFPGMDETDIDEVSKHLMFVFVTENPDINLEDLSTLNKKSMIESIENAMNLYIEQNAGDPELVKRGEMVLRSKVDFKEELIGKLEDLGIRYKQSLVNEKTGLSNESEESEDKIVDKMGLKDSYEKDPKESMNAKVKLMLSQLPDDLINPDYEGNIFKFRSKYPQITDKALGQVIGMLQSGQNPGFTQEDVDLIMTPRLIGKAGRFLGETSFVEFKEVQETLMKALEGTVAYNSGSNMSDIFALMTKKIDDIKLVKPWAFHLLNRMKDMKSLEERARFVQSFAKVQLNFYVTEYNKGKKDYKVYNATSTNSKDSQLRSAWNMNFRREFLSEGILTPNGRAILEGIQIEVGQAMSDAMGAVKAAKVQDGKEGNLNREYELAAYNDGAENIIELLNKVGAELELGDFQAQVKRSGGDINAEREFTDLASAAVWMMDTITNPETKFTEKGEAMNPFDTQSGIKAISEAQALFRPDMADSNVLANGGKSYHSFTQPSYVHNTVNQWKGDRTEMEAIATRAYTQGSRWIKYFLGLETDLNGDLKLDGNDQLRESKNRIDGIKVGLSTSFKSAGKNDGTDVKEQKYVDALNESVVKTLGFMAKKKTYAQTLIPADKGRKIEIEGMPTFESMIEYKNGEWVISDKSKEAFMEYFEAEYNRMQEAYGELQTLPENKLIMHYHIGAKNAFKSQLFPELSPENMDKNSVEFATLYDTDGMPLGREEDKYTITGLSDNQKLMVKTKIEETLKKRLDEAVADFDASTAIHVGENDAITNISVDESILAAYEEKGYEDPMRALIADHFMNSAINTIEYNKMFLGDPAYFKNMPDMIKRTPASYTDGLPMYLEGMKSEVFIDENGDEQTKQVSDEFFNQATIESPIIGSKYIELLRSSVKDKKIAEFYKEGINMADAQAWITPERWKFIKTRLGQWTVAHDKVYDKMLSGAKMTTKELHLAAQPLKGVYFEINNNAPTYLKYSQAVLIPQLIQDVEMKALFDKMTKGPDGKTLPYEEQIHEVVTLDGIKAGAMAPTKIHEEDGSFKKEFSLNKNVLKNRGWKLQQDLPTKTVHATMVGSQIQKNILAGIDMSTETRRDLFKNINDTVSQLSNMGKANLMEKFAIDAKTNKIGNKEKLYSSLIAEYKRNGGNDNVVAALEKEMPFDAIPQVRGKVENIFMSMMNKELTSIYTSGGSFIQVSPFGLESGHNKKDRNAGVKIVSDNYDGKGLKPPHKDHITGKYMPGQCFLPYSSLISLLPKDKAADYNKMSGEELMKLIDPEVLKIIGYRIPNQGMSSNDCMEVVGILPEGCGDQIVAYDAVPAKTGSDFDIDKMYMMMPHMFYNKKTGRVEKVPTSLTDAQIKELGLDPIKAQQQAVQNKLIGLYEQVLLSEKAYDKVMTTIDGEFLKVDIVGDKKSGKRGLYPEKKLKNLDFYSPAFQMRTRFEYLSGKVGVAQTANQLVDHVLNRNLNMRMKGYIGVGKASGEDTELDPEYDVNGRYLVADAVSAFLNAYVDIAKDPYISRCNHNNTTAGVTFLLLRSGVPLEWVNRFIGQPVLKELVEAIKNGEGITSDTLMIDGKRVSPKQYIADRYKLDLTAELSPADVARVYAKGDEHLEKNIFAKEDNEVVSLESQRDVLRAFLYLQTRAKELNQSTTASKTPDFGDFGQLLSAKNKFLNVVDEGNILGFEDKFKNTMTGTYKNNGIDWVQRLAKDNNLFITSNPVLEGTANSISSRVGKGERITDEDMIKTISSSFYSYLMSGFKLFENNRKDLQTLFTDLPNQILAMKENSTNFLIQELEIRDSGLFSYIKINSKNKPKTYTNKIVRAWSDLLRSTNKEEVQLAVRLAKYAYSQSGLKNNLNQFYRYIPHELLLAQGINGYIKTAHAEMNSIDTDEEFRDQMFRHNSDDTNLVPQVTMNDIQVVEAGTYTDAGFIYSPTERNRLSTGVNKSGFDTYPEFVALAGAYDLDGERGENTLYKLLGSVNDIDYSEVEAGRSEEPKVVRRPIYVRTYKLGTKSNHGSIFEYQKRTKADQAKVTKSIIKENNLSPTELEKQKDIIALAMSRDSFLPAEHMLDPHEANQMTEEQLAEIQEKEKAMAVQEKSTTLATEKINIYAGANQNSDLSNFAKRPFDDNGDVFDTVEGYFQARKMDFSSEPYDVELLEKFKKATGSSAKSMGRQVKGLKVKEWDANAYGVMKEGLKMSFEQNPEALKRLLDTGNAELTHTQDKTRWGSEFPKALMEVREELRGNNAKPKMTDAEAMAAMSGEIEVDEDFDTDEDDTDNIEDPNACDVPF